MKRGVDEGFVDERQMRMIYVVNNAEEAVEKLKELDNRTPMLADHLNISRYPTIDPDGMHP